MIANLPTVAPNGLPARYVPFDAVEHLFDTDLMLRVGGTRSVWTDNGLDAPEAASLTHVADTVIAEAEKSQRVHSHAKTCLGGTEGRPCMICGRVTEP